MASDLQSKLREFGLADRKVLRALSADVVHVWSTGNVGLSIIFKRDEVAYLQLATRCGDAYSVYRCGLGQVSPQLFHSAIECLQRGQYIEKKGVEIRIGDGSDGVLLYAEG